MAETIKTPAAAPDKTEILRQEAALEKKNRWLYPTVIAVLIVFFIVGFSYGLATVLRMEGAYPPVTLTEGKTPAPASAEAALAYLKTVCGEAADASPRLEGGRSFRFNGDSVETDGSEALKNTLKFLIDPVEDRLDDAFGNAAAEFGDGKLREAMQFPDFGDAAVSDFTCEYIYYKCISCGEESAEPLAECEICGSEHPYQMRYRDDYTITLELTPGDAALAEAFFAPDAAAAYALLAPETENALTLENVTERISRLYVTFRAERETNHLKYLCYGKEAAVSADAVFTGDYAALGRAHISAEATARQYYDLTWPGLSLNTHTLVLEPKESNNLLATLICDDPVAYDAVWETSDESVVTVDEDGYLKAAGTPGRASVTASYEFQGKTYSDSCEVIVRVPVESMTLNKRRLTLGVGENAALTAKVSPKDATEQGAAFFTENEAVATVDENGVVTAVAPGVAVVYALSNDGYYRSSCEVTVK